MKIDDDMIDRISIEVRDDVNKEKFKNTCWRNFNIFTSLFKTQGLSGGTSKEGVICTECGKCSIGVIKKKADKLGYSLYIVPGSSFVKIVKENNFKAVIGVACHEDLNQMMMLLSDYCPQGVLLSKTGCFETKVDIKKYLKN